MPGERRRSERELLRRRELAEGVVEADDSDPRRSLESAGVDCDVLYRYGDTEGMRYTPEGVPALREFAQCRGDEGDPREVEMKPNSGSRTSCVEARVSRAMLRGGFLASSFFWRG